MTEPFRIRRYRKAGLRARLACWLFGHKPHRYYGTFYIACERCEAVLNFGGRRYG